MLPITTGAATRPSVTIVAWTDALYMFTILGAMRLVPMAQLRGRPGNPNDTQYLREEWKGSYTW